MNQEQLSSLFRTVLQVVMTMLVTKGLLDANQAAALQTAFMTAVPALVLIATTFWGLYVRRRDGLIASAAAQPEVRKIETDPLVAVAVPSPKVVPPAGA